MKPKLHPMTVYTGVMAAVFSALGVLGFVLALTIEPDAINMGLGAGLSSVFLWILFAVMANIDKM